MILNTGDVIRVKSFAFMSKGGGTGLSDSDGNERFDGEVDVRITKRWDDYETGERAITEAVSPALVDYLKRNAKDDDQRVFVGQFDVAGRKSPMEEMEEIFGKSIYTYTRAQAIEDGVLISGMTGDLEEVSRQHFKSPIAMTAAVFGIMERAVQNKRHCNDFKGVWHDILWMSKACGRVVDESTRIFPVTITGAGRKRLYHFKIVCGPGDNGEPVMTIMLPEED